MNPFLMPSLGADMEAGTLVEWLKAPGDAIAKGDLIAVVETQKGAIEIEVFEDGTLDSYLAEIGKEVPVGTPLAMIRAPGESAATEQVAAPEIEPEPVSENAAEPAPKPEAEPVPEPVPEPEAEPAPAPKAPATAPPLPPTQPLVEAAGDRLRITPAARQLAQTAGLDPAGIAAADGDAIHLADVKAALDRPKPPADSGMREAIAAAMSRSKREIPHYYLSHTCDITRAEGFIARTNSGRPPEQRVLLGALTLRAVATALEKFPEFNGYFTDGQFAHSADIHVGTAIHLRRGGLVAPALFNTNSATLDDVMAGLRDLVQRVRIGRYRASELSGATITVTSLGERGVEQLFGVIYPPQVAIVGFGCPVDRVGFVDGQIAPRRTVTVTLAADHRVSDGHRGALFLKAIDKHLQAPEAL